MTASSFSPEMLCPWHLLEPDEQAIWWGRPDPRSYARQGIGRALFVGIWFVGLGAFLSTKAIEARQLVPVLLCALAIMIGLYAMSEPLRRYLKARRLVYLLTNRRALIADEGRFRTVLLKDVGEIGLNWTGGPFGDVLYCDRPVEGSTRGERVEDGFLGIADAEAVANEMRRLKAAA
jgi:hypothetical protein